MTSRGRKPYLITRKRDRENCTLISNYINYRIVWYSTCSLERNVRITKPFSVENFSGVFGDFTHVTGCVWGQTIFELRQWDFCVK